MPWELISEEPHDATERMAIDGGYLYRSAWRHKRDIGQDMLSGSALVFVAGPQAKKPDPVILTPQEPVDEKAAEVEEVHTEVARGKSSKR